MPSVTYTAPLAGYYDPIDVVSFCEHAKVDSDYAETNLYIEGVLAAARRAIENATGRVLGLGRYLYTWNELQVNQDYLAYGGLFVEGVDTLNLSDLQVKDAQGTYQPKTFRVKAQGDTDLVVLCDEALWPTSNPQEGSLTGLAPTVMLTVDRGLDLTLPAYQDLVHAVYHQATYLYQQNRGEDESLNTAFSRTMGLSSYARTVCMQYRGVVCG